MRATLLIALKDLRQRARDRSAFLIAIVVPLALAFIFSQILGDVSNDSLTFAFAVVDEDGGTAAGAFVDEVLAPLEDEGLIALTVADSAASGRQLAEDGDVNATFILPAGFSAAVESGQGAEIEVIGNVGAPIGTMVASSIARSFANQLTSIQTSVATVASSGGSDPTAIAALAARAAAMPDAIAFEDVSATRKELESTTFYAAGMAVFFMFFTVQFGISSLLDERREGTMKRLLVAPIRRSSILFGKLGASFVLGVISMAVLATGTSLLLGAEWGNPVGVGLLIVAGVVAAMAVMAFIATLARTAEQAGNLQSIVALGFGMLGGSFFPVAQAGGFIEKLSLITPHAWFLRGVGELQTGGGVVDVLPAVAAILGFAAVTGALAFLRRERLVGP